MSGKIRKIELKSGKTVLKSKNNWHENVKVALLRDNGGTFTSQKCHFYHEKQACFSPKNNDFRSFFIAHFPQKHHNPLWHNHLCLHTKFCIFAGVRLLFSKTATYTIWDFSKCKHISLFTYILIFIIYLICHATLSEKRTCTQSKW